MIKPPHFPTHLPCQFHVDLNMRHVEEVPFGFDLADHSCSPTQPHRPHALTPRDEERRLQFQIGGTEQVFVDENHGHGNDPVSDDHAEDLERLSPYLVRSRGAGCRRVGTKHFD